MDHRFITAVLFGLLSATSALADDAGTNKSKLWPYGPYDKLHRDPAVIVSNQPPIIIQRTTTNRTQILIYRGTQESAADLTTTNIIVVPKLELHPK